MTDVDPEDLETPDELREMGPLLRDLARHDSVSDEALERLRARLATSLPDVALGPLDPPTNPPSTPAPNTGAPTGSGVATSGKLLFAAYGLAVGAVLGGLAVHAYEGRTSQVENAPISAPTPAPTVVEVPSPPHREPTAPASTDTSAPSSTLARPHSSVEPAPPSAPKASSGSTLNAERLVVDVARSAYARGDRDEALRALARHATTYPEGALAEEREALAIRILVDAGRASEARARGQKFRTRYPKSLMLPAVEAALESIP
jgi:TolA-binding protein